MNRLTREVFVECTRELLTRQGCPDISLSSVLNACEANKGSLYHFFPKGKHELVVAAIEKQASCAIAMNQGLLAESKTTSEAVFNIVSALAKAMDASDFSLCLPFSAVGAVSGEASEELRTACTETLSKLESLFAKSLKRDGFTAKMSRELASVIVSVIEGALLQARTRQAVVPLRNAATVLRDLIQSKAPELTG